MQLLDGHKNPISKKIETEIEGLKAEYDQLAA